MTGAPGQNRPQMQAWSSGHPEGHAAALNAAMQVIQVDGQEPTPALVAVVAARLLRATQVLNNDSASGASCEAPSSGQRHIYSNSSPADSSSTGGASGGAHNRKLFRAVNNQLHSAESRAPRPLSPAPGGGSSSGSSRSRGRVTCQVAGCLQDLTSGRETYTGRYRVCARHIVEPAVVLYADQPHELYRFCNQCFKFEKLAAFDGTKRGCRASLAKRRERSRNKKLQQAAAAAAAAAGTAAQGQWHQQQRSCYAPGISPLASPGTSPRAEQFGGYFAPAAAAGVFACGLADGSSEQAAAAAPVPGGLMSELSPPKSCHQDCGSGGGATRSRRDFFQQPGAGMQRSTTPLGWLASAPLDLSMQRCKSEPGLAGVAGQPPGSNVHQGAAEAAGGGQNCPDGGHYTEDDEDNVADFMDMRELSFTLMSQRPNLQALGLLQQQQQAAVAESQAAAAAAAAAAAEASSRDDPSPFQQQQRLLQGSPRLSAGAGDVLDALPCERTPSCSHSSSNPPQPAAATAAAAAEGAAAGPAGASAARLAAQQRLTASGKLSSMSSVRSVVYDAMLDELNAWFVNPNMVDGAVAGSGPEPRLQSEAATTAAGGGDPRAAAALMEEQGASAAGAAWSQQQLPPQPQQEWHNWQQQQLMAERQQQQLVPAPSAPAALGSAGAGSSAQAAAAAAGSEGLSLQHPYGLSRSSNDYGLAQSLPGASSVPLLTGAGLLSGRSPAAAAAIQAQQLERVYDQAVSVLVCNMELAAAEAHVASAGPGTICTLLQDPGQCQEQCQHHASSADLVDSWNAALAAAGQPGKPLVRQQLLQHQQQCEEQRRRQADLSCPSRKSPEAATYRLERQLSAAQKAMADMERKLAALKSAQGQQSQQQAGP